MQEKREESEGIEHFLLENGECELGLGVGKKEVPSIHEEKGRGLKRLKIVYSKREKGLLGNEGWGQKIFSQGKKGPAFL